MIGTVGELLDILQGADRSDKLAAKLHVDGHIFWPDIEKVKRVQTPWGDIITELTVTSMRTQTRTEVLLDF